VDIKYVGCGAGGEQLEAVKKQQLIVTKTPLIQWANQDQEKCLYQVG